jgi:tetratricopeptide (TPR) repeat protein
MARVATENPLPPGWFDEFLDKADFDRSFAQLDGYTHFYAEASKGNIRSQQLRFEEAWQHFDRAQELVDSAEENIPNLIREFLLHIWCFENAIVEAPLIETNIDPPALWIPELPRQVMEDYPEVKLVLNMRRNAEALLRLHLGHWDESSELYRELIEDNQKERGDQLAFYYFGLASCQHNLGMPDEARRNLENSGFAILSGGRTANRAKAAAILYALYSHLGEEEIATSWVQFLESLPCPKATKDVFLERGRILLDRCAQRSNLLVL